MQTLLHFIVFILSVGVILSLFSVPSVGWLAKTGGLLFVELALVNCNLTGHFHLFFLDLWKMHGQHTIAYACSNLLFVHIVG